MKHKRKIALLLSFSLIITLIGFFLDTDERVSDMSENIKDFVLMTLLIFMILSGMYFFIVFLANIINKSK
jgi:hypothetical protein